MLKQCLIIQILNQTDHSLKEKIKKVIELLQYKLSGKIMKELAGLRAVMKIKKRKAQKSVSLKENLYFKNIKLFRSSSNSKQRSSMQERTN